MIARSSSIDAASRGEPPPGLIVTAPASGSGKTTLTLGLLRALRRRGVAVGSAKVGPDYIDPAFHHSASGRPCYNLDPWAMRAATLARLARRCGDAAELVIVEGVMGMFDGASGGGGSSADLAELSGWPLLLVVDAGGMAASAAALLHGFSSYRPSVAPAAVIFNRVGSERHGRLLREVCADSDIAVLGALPADAALTLPERHLGLVQAQEHAALDAFLDAAADRVAAHVDLDALRALARPTTLTAPAHDADADAEPPGRRIALAQDRAFSFCYPHLRDLWRAAGAELLPFSPLADQPPDASADWVYLPGGYPELYPQTLAANRRFLSGLRRAAERGATVFGECGGYMVLGESLTDRGGRRHAMAGLLPVAASFAAPRLHLGYRDLTLLADGPFGRAGERWRGHEFHYASAARVDGRDAAAPLFDSRSADGRALGPAGCRDGAVAGSFMHLIDRCGGAV